MCFLEIEDYDKPKLENKNQIFNIKFNGHPDDEEIDRTSTIIEKLHKNEGKDLTLVYKRFDVTLLADTFEKFPEVCFEEDKLYPKNFVSLPG